jgi:hypothetical protein
MPYSGILKNDYFEKADPMYEGSRGLKTFE